MHVKRLIPRSGQVPFIHFWFAKNATSYDYEGVYELCDKGTGIKNEGTLLGDLNTQARSKF